MSNNSLFSIFSGKYFNQNLICFIVGYLGVFFAEKSKNSECLTLVCWVILIFSTVSLVITLCFYTIEYVLRSSQKQKIINSDTITQRTSVRKMIATLRILYLGRNKTQADALQHPPIFYFTINQKLFKICLRNYFIAIL